MKSKQSVSVPACGALWISSVQWATGQTVGESSNWAISREVVVHSVLECTSSEHAFSPSLLSQHYAPWSVRDGFQENNIHKDRLLKSF